VNGSADQIVLPAQKEWLAKVDEAYWSAESGEDEVDDDGREHEVREQGDQDVEMGGTSPARDSVLSSGSGDVLQPLSSSGVDVVDGIDRRYVGRVLAHWAEVTGVKLETLLTTTYRVVESDVGKDKGSDVDRVNALAHAAGGGW
jgi:hypothetical protein